MNKIILYFLCSIFILCSINYLFRYNYKDGFDTNSSKYAYLDPITLSNQITNDTLNAVLDLMLKNNLIKAADSSGMSNLLKSFLTEEEGQYYIKNKVFPVDTYISDYITYVKGTTDYKNLHINIQT